MNTLWRYVRAAVYDVNFIVMHWMRRPFMLAARRNAFPSTFSKISDNFEIICS
jgi:hypothetical protein